MLYISYHQMEVCVSILCYISLSHSIGASIGEILATFLLGLTLTRDR